MKVLEFSYRNILSYGNQLQTFEFTEEPQLILVEGENGAGKSSIKEALTIAIYGKSAIRKMKDIPNWLNKNAYTNIKFITNSGDRVEIDRGIEPNFSNIKINSSDYNLPDKRKVDDFVEDELAKIPFSVFCNTISLSFDEFKSFVTLNQADKRKIVDRIFGIDILTDMKNVVKDDLKEHNKELDLINSEIQKNREILEKSIDQLNTLKEKLSKKKEDTSGEINNLLATKTIEINAIRTEFSSYKLEITECTATITEIRQKVSDVKSTIRELGIKLDIYNKNRCPHCLNDLTTDTSIKTKDIIQKKKEAIELSLPKLNESLSSFNTKLEEITNKQNISKSEFYKINADIENLQKQLQLAKSDIESDETGSIQAIISSISDDISSSEKKIREKQGHTDLYQELDELLSDYGIKKSLMDKIIPTLNNRIFEISTKLEFKFNFEFDGDFNPIISYLGMEISPESLSTGQRKKMNLIVLLAFIELIKMKHTTMNVMFLDEIFSSLSKNNVYQAIEILREYADKYKITIFVVSHESLPEEFFDSKIVVTTHDHFSEMEVISNKKINQKPEAVAKV